ncbi:MAG: 3,4-dihydroxy-2-butanone 4-phosphate synthase / GTP cyclohydrolase II [uncultured Sphingomonas sp.]|uniref:GTP cyclohydrolase-2 n=1 Tax=uncultured Sphingomonas sp. TaxID=158754 RepID=A0A6J4SW64_9SPHN|nr:MAG: 3,4-dihydroxy-2-butanone 4-phosphate synthase / GTP cyclohydrolase II [uncultured Sphingomonas sp.]
MSHQSSTRRGIAALRAGRAVRIVGGDPITVLPVETATPELLALLDPASTAKLLISGERAAALSLANVREAADPSRPVLIDRAPWLDSRTALELADPGRDLARPPVGPLQPLAVTAVEPMQAALQLARLAGLLPALWLVPEADAAAAVAADEIAHAQPQVELVARARLPLQGMPSTQVAAYRALGDGQEHAVLLIGAFGGKPPLVRLHSECLTGDVFGSLKCDCGPQLQAALRIIGDAGGGLLLYLRQEGRGIGLGNKLRAYSLQDRGLDTVDANRRLGFADDERQYGHAAAILRALGADRVRLLTNNPNKVASLEQAGIEVVERVAHHMPANPHNAHYLATKRRKSGHLA